MTTEERMVRKEPENKGTIEDLTKDAERLIEIGNECFVKSHILLYGEKITDSNKLTAIPYNLAKLLSDMHPILDMLTKRGYREVGWINLEWVRNKKYNDSLEHNQKWLGGRRFIVNEWRGLLTGFAGFDGYVLSRASENPTKSPHDLYLVRLSYDEESSNAISGIVDTELRMRNYEDPEIWKPLNIQQEPEVVVMMDPTTNPTFDELTKHLRDKIYNGIIGRWGLTGKYRVWKIGKLEKVPSNLFKPASIIKKREERECSYLKGTDHFYIPHIDLHSLNANYSVGYEVEILDRI